MSAKTSHGLTKNIYSTALTARRRPGQGLKVVTTNVDSANALDVRVQAALGPADTFETHDFSVATTLYEATGVAALDVDAVEWGVASALHTNYRVQVAASVASPLASGDYSVYAQTGESIEAD